MTAWAPHWGVWSAADTALATETYLTERFVTALEAEPQVYRRILNTICSLGATLLQSGTLILNWSNPGKVRMHCDMHTLKRTNTAMSEHSATTKKMRL